MKRRILRTIMICFVFGLLLVGGSSSRIHAAVYRSSDSKTEYFTGSISGRKITFSGKIPTKNTKGYVRLFRVVKKGDKYTSSHEKVVYFRVKNKKFKTSISLPSQKGNYQIEVYFQTRTGRILYCYNNGKKATFFRSSRYKSDVNALQFIRSMKKKTTLVSTAANRYTISGSKLSLTKAQRNKIASFAKKLCKGKKSDYSKAKAIYKWVVTHIYYNYDVDGVYDNGNNNAYFVFTKHYAVCEGYVRILQEMLSSQGIPNAYLYGDGNGGMKLDSSSTLHAWVAIYAGKRWFFADPTWDSNNGYSHKKWSKAASDMIYFDMNSSSFSMTHAVEGVETGERLDYFPITFMNRRVTALTYEGNKSEITYPSKFRGMAIQAINSQFISQNFNSKVVSITIPSGYQYMDSYALQYYIGLNRLYLPNSVKSISKGMLVNSYRKTKVYAKSTSYAYRRCRQLKYITVMK